MKFRKIGLSCNTSNRKRILFKQQKRSSCEGNLDLLHDLDDSEATRHRNTESNCITLLNISIDLQWNFSMKNIGYIYKLETVSDILLNLILNRKQLIRYLYIYRILYF